ncbi:Phosphatidylinositol 4-phosphate 5-kinase type-1 alpha [Hypsibius exemplaris]|uniref:Phosphatidylinositol 4-phosphate 5-kinase type-1 alpha n=1 Tax=Hypsibius exemplaris TaxID=2072580 RepID=A0A9X6NQE0_HYPEX|nr:Phosphatidylinositol 4-phosphate 5-kinase type-1 alpha [Hypsibius exemplaris]
MNQQNRAYRESMLMAGPLSMSVSEPHLNANSPDVDASPNGHANTLGLPRMDERRNSDGGLNTLPRHKSKLGHRRVDPEGNVTFKRVPSNKLMQSIQEGIRHSVSKLASEPERDVLFTDFENTEIVLHPEAGTKYTPAHNNGDFHFKTYAPIAFRHFREAFEISPDDYMMSICLEPLIEISNPGASGSLFYLTEDEMFILKTVEHSEAEFLLKLLPQYYMNIVQNPRTLLPKFFGLYCYKAFGKNVRILVMDNILPRRIKYHHKFDLKGSSYNRFASEKEKTKTVPTLKDVDFAEHYPGGIFLDNETYYQLMSLFKRDCLVLQSFKIMDYSLLLGIHNIDTDLKEQQGKGDDSQPGSPDSPQEDPTKGLGRTRSINRHRLAAMPRTTPEEEPRGGSAAFFRQQSTQSQAYDEMSKILAQAHIDPDVIGGAILGKTANGERLLIFLGIIDILQYWRLRKKLEHAFKSLIHDGNTISVCHPTYYAKRYQEFMAEKVFHPQVDPANFRLQDIPLRLGSGRVGPTSGTLQQRGSISRTSASPVGGKDGSSLPRRTNGFLASHIYPTPDVVASASGGTDASSSAGYPSRPQSLTASPRGGQRAKLSSLYLRREQRRSSDAPASLEDVAITVADIADVEPYDIRKQRAGSDDTVSATRLRVVAKNGVDGATPFSEGDVFVVTAVSEATQTFGGTVKPADIDYEETDL